MKRISVLVPAWNAAGTIAPSVQSALDDDPRIEVVVVDDASTDDTSAVVRSLQERHPGRILHDVLARNSGPAAARNRALEMATGNWIALLDSDDLWIPGRVARLEPLLAQADVVSDALEVREGQQCRIIPRLPRSSQLVLDRLLLVQRDLGYLQPFMRSDFLKTHGISWNAGLRHSEDFLLSWRLLGQGARWLHLQEPGYVYIRNGASLTGQRRKGLQQGMELIERLLPEVSSDARLRDALGVRHAIKSDLLVLEDAREHPSASTLLRALPSLLRLANRRIREAMR